MALLRIGRLEPKNTVLFLCDMQENFRPSTQYFAEIVEVSNRMVRGAKLLDIPVVVTEHYRKDWGLTVKELGIEEEGLKLKIFEKTQFSMMIPDVENHLKSLDRQIKSILLCGVDAQICVQNTALSLLEKGYDVHLIADACSSRTLVDRKLAYDRMKQSGAFITSSESAMFALISDTTHKKYKEMEEIFSTVAPNSDLLKIL